MVTHPLYTAVNSQAEAMLVILNFFRQECPALRAATWAFNCSSWAWTNALDTGDSSWKCLHYVKFMFSDNAAATSANGGRAWLGASEDVVREVVHHGDPAIHVPAQVVVDLAGYEKASVCRDVAVLEYHVA